MIGTNYIDDKYIIDTISFVLVKKSSTLQCNLCVTVNGVENVFNNNYVISILNNSITMY